MVNEIDIRRVPKVVIPGGTATLKNVYQNVNAWMTDGRFQWVNTLLEQIHVEDFSIDIILALLTVTLRFHAEIATARHAFFEKVKAEIDRRGITEKGLLDGLG